MSALDVIRSAALEGVPHGFLGRKGGVSTGDYAGLNVGIGSDDDAAAVRTHVGVGQVAEVGQPRVGGVGDLDDLHAADCALRPRATAAAGR